MNQIETACVKERERERDRQSEADIKCVKKVTHRQESNLLL